MYNLDDLDKKSDKSSSNERLIHQISRFSKFDFKSKFFGDSDWNITEWLEIFNIHCMKCSMYDNEKLL